MKVAICVGHSRRILGKLDGGAVSAGGVNEHTFNGEVAGRFAEKLKAFGITPAIFDSYVGNGYTAAMRDVTYKVRKFGADLALELHFNAADGVAKGYEYLCHNGSANGKRLATILLSEHGREYPVAKARGVKPLTSGDRGYEFVNLTHCPAVICEPFFGDNEAEWNLYSGTIDRLAEVYANAVYKYFV